jgi:predicted PurR-regulated permease PerM
MPASRNSALHSEFRALQYVLVASLLLYLGRDFLVPVSLSVLISFILFPICSWLEKKGVGRMAAAVLGVTLIVLLFVSLVALLVWQVVAFFDEWPGMREKLIQSLGELSSWLTSQFDMTREQQNQWIEELRSSPNWVVDFLKDAVSVSTVSLVLIILVPIYSILILYYRNMFAKVLYGIFPDQRSENIREILHLAIHSYYRFIRGMALVYLIVGILNSLGLWMLGIPHAALFGFVASVLTFVPYVGILVASLLPISVAWLTYSSVWYPVGVVAVFGVVQYLEANVIFPLAVSSQLKVNTLMTIIAIVLGGLLWGVMGMILFVPFLAILKLVADRSPRMRTLAMLLGTSRE